MKRWFFATLISLAASCGSDGDKAPEVTAEEKAWSDWADRACECSDAACARARSDEYWKLPDKVRMSVAERASERGKACLEPHGGLTLE